MSERFRNKGHIIKRYINSSVYLLTYLFTDTIYNENKKKRNYTILLAYYQTTNRKQ